MPLTLTVLQYGTNYHFVWNSSAPTATAPPSRYLFTPTQSLYTTQLDLQQYTELQQAVTSATQIARQLAAQAIHESGRASATLHALERLGRMMFNQLLPPAIQNALRALPVGSSLVICTNESQLPWELLHDDRQFLALHLALGRQLLTASTARQNPTRLRERYRCLLIGNPTGDLPAAQNEIVALFDVLDSLGVEPELISDTQATCERVRGELASGYYDIIHYAGHTRPGAIRLADGWLTSEKIYQALRGSPLIFLNSCASLREIDAANTSEADTVALPAGEPATRDLAAAFLLGGARAFIGTFWPIFDTGAPALAVDFYRLLLQGTALGAALRQARERSAQATIDTLIWSAVALYGDPAWQFAQHRIHYPHSTVLIASLADPPERWQPTAATAALQTTQRLTLLWQQTVATFDGQLVHLSPTRFVAIFGIPHTVEDDAERALLAAFEFLRLCQQELEHSRLPLPALGVASGPTILEAPTGTERIAPLYLGSALALAEECVKQSHSGQIVAAMSTRHLTEDKFSFTPTGVYLVEQPTFLVTPRSVTVARVIVSPVAPAQTPPLIGRDEELAALKGYWQRVQRGRGQVVGVVGAAGIGKSRLVQALGAACINDPHRWLSAQCSIATQQTSYALLRQLLHSLLDLSSHHSATQNEEKLRLHVAQLPNQSAWKDGINILQQLLGQSQLQFTPEEQKGQQNRRVQLLRVLLAQAAKATPLIIVLDNMHLVDEASLELLVQVTEGIQQLPLLLLLLYRPGWNHPWLTRQEQFQSLPLAALDRAAQIHLLQAWLESAELPRNLPALLERTDGNPLFLEEALRSLREQGVLLHQAGEWILTPAWTEAQLPPTVQRIMLARIKRLPSLTQQVLQVAAVIDAEFGESMIGAVLGEETSTLLPHLQECDLLRSDWISGKFQIRHPLIQEVIYQTLPLEERQRIHRRVGGLLAQQMETANDSALIAHHYYHSHDRVNAILYGLRAVQQAASDWANSIAIDWSNRVLEKLATFSSQPMSAREQAQGCQPEQLLEWQLLALEQKGEAQARLGLNEAAIACYQAALTLLQNDERIPPMRAVAFYIKLTESYLSRSELEAAWSAIAVGKEIVQEAPCAELGELLFWQAILHYRRQQLNEALATSHQAIVSLQTVGSARYLARSYTLQGILYDELGHPYHAQAVHALEEGIRLSKAENYLPGVARASSNLGILYEKQGQWESALRCYRDALEASERSGDERQLATAFLDFSEPYRHQGNFEESIKYAEQAKQTAELRQFPDIACVAHINLALVYLHLGQFQTVILHLSTAEALLNEHDLAHFRPDLLNAQAELALARQDWSQARLYIQLALQEASVMPMKIGQLQRNLGLSLLAVGEFEAAAQALTQSRQLFQAEQNPYEYAHTLLAWAAYYHQQSNAQLAFEHGTQALQLFRTLGASFDVQRTEQFLHSHQLA